MEASRWPMVIEPLSLIFFRVPSCAAAGTARARARAARISVGRFMSVSLWAVRVGGCVWVGEAARFYGSPPFLVQAAGSTAQRQNASGGLEFDLEPPEGAGHEPGGDAHRARSPGRPGGPRRSLLRDPHAARAGEFPDHGDRDL